MSRRAAKPVNLDGGHDDVSANADSFAAKVGRACAEELIRLGVKEGRDPPEVVGRRLVLRLLVNALGDRDDSRMWARGQYERAAKSLGLNDEEAALILGMDSSDYASWLGEEILEATRTDEEILELTMALHQVLEVMGPGVGHSWLYFPNTSLDVLEPARVLEDGQAGKVCRLLDQMATAGAGSADDS